MAEFEFKFIYKYIIICIDCFVVNKNMLLVEQLVLFLTLRILFLSSHCFDLPRRNSSLSSNEMTLLYPYS